MSLINCEINLELNWSKNCVIVVTAVVNQGATFSIADRKPYVSVFTLSTKDNAKLIEQPKPGIKRTINCNNIYQRNQQKDRLNI